MKQTRRQFLTTASTAGAGILLHGMTLPESNNVKAKEGFSLNIFATRWGFKGSIDDYCKQVKKEGYDGIEEWFPRNEVDENALYEALDKYNLKLGVLAGSGGNTFDAHQKSYAENLQKVISKKPEFINCHAGKDYLSFQQKKLLIEFAVNASKESGIPIYQETHRGRMLYAAHVCEEFIDVVPDLKLTLDISHWCAVSESLLADQKQAVEKALKRVGHVHSRIGHEEGPQVSEPRAPEWQRAVNAHYAWWDTIVNYKKQAGEPLTMTTEFGPANYMWSMPYTKQPLADQWAINVHMMNEWRKRYL
ncbi:sugar phosphate isomerase/epimerase family protein [Aestuariibaculum sediminum]|uniref:Sugar phosphate isomerase/epimerase n=1 Tax=Aestuariibaculum sediminum TaxID=2770637 RepID=A0A8J6Q1A3_9FLAO|nr:sugar phosphate isomerase/epimerase [Aestuariibaculum sediminum]MBD0830914.1 sugar phosphate isomerase/epimerase [Aestuariibaculum sediminum]